MVTNLSQGSRVKRPKNRTLFAVQLNEILKEKSSKYAHLYSTQGSKNLSGDCVDFYFLLY